MLIFNFIGLAMLAVSFGVAFGVGHLIGPSADGPLMMMAGPLAFVCERLYRWPHPTTGGYLPCCLKQPGSRPG